MVDFNNSTIVGKSRTDIVNIMVLSRRSDAIDAIRLYYARKYKNKEKGMYEFQSEIAALFHEIQQIISNELPKEKTETYDKPEQILEDIESGDEKRVLRAWQYMDRLLYSKGITKIDKKELYDRTNIFESNRRESGN